MILKDIWLDVKAVKERDPAARNSLEVLLLYQGVHALIWHRIAHLDMASSLTTAQAS